MRQLGETMMGIYHSHPRSPAYPSKSDVELAFYSDSVYFIVSLAAEVETRAFRIESGEIRGVEIVVGEDSSALG
jgi:proteasome lid subunit RPN8/RPN11